MAKTKRETIRRYLKKRLTESKRGIKTSIDYDDITTVMGGTYDEERENQYRKNMQADIEEIEFLLNCMDSKKSIDKIL